VFPKVRCHACGSALRHVTPQGLDKLELVTLPSGLSYRDIVVGDGPSPPPGFQVRAASLHA
jgi:FKBP-type peptidyl-prolyl cis-trans isomerase